MRYQGGGNYEFVELKWKISAFSLLSDDGRLRNNAHVWSKMFGTLDGRYKFRINFSGRNRRFKLVVIKSSPHAMFAFSLKLSGMAHAILERNRSHYFPPKRLWLLWIPNERQFQMTDLIIKCVVRINEMCFPLPPPVTRIPIPEGPREGNSSLDIGAHANGLAGNHRPQGCLLDDDIPANVQQGPCLEPSR
uniref:Uncharacterized protein n=1 Tax=Trichuris muris TaxID=70415 RepID=A0A5S6QC73_TRIMR